MARLAKIFATRLLTRLFGTTSRVSGALIGVGILISVPGGGFDKVRDDVVPVAALGKPVDAGFMTVSISGVRLLPDNEVLNHRHKGDRWIAVIAQVEVTDDLTVGSLTFQSAFRLTGVQGLRGNVKDSITGQALADNAVLARDSQMAITLQPGVPERIGVVWEQAASAPLPRTAQVEVYHFSEVTNSLSGESGYWRPGEVPAAKVSGIAVQDRRNG